MKIQNIFIVFMTVASINTSKAQNKIVHKAVIGYNFGATSPAPIPAEVRKIDSYNIGFTPKLGYNIIYNFNNKWAVQSGILLDYKGMKVTDRVKYMYTNVVMDGENIKGYFVGRNETKIKLTYITIPINIMYNINELWALKAGGYFSYCTYSKFSGSVWDGYLRESENDDILHSMKIEIENKGDATFDFSDEIKNVDIGLSVGVERKINKKLGISGDFSWGLTPIFPSSFKGIDVNMHNIYFTIGASYQL